MKTLLFSTILLVCATLLSGCAMGPNSGMVINPLDWHGPSAAGQYPSTPAG